MIARNSKCVYVANTVDTAQQVAAWLSEAGVPAEVTDHRELGDAESLTGIMHDDPRQVEVWVVNVEQITEAQSLLVAMADELESKIQVMTVPTGNVTAVCEECGKSSEFPAAERGTVQTCPHCHKWIDIPAPDDDWDVGDSASED